MIRLMYTAIKFVCVAALLFALIPSLVLAQSAATGALTGTVTDPTGAVVPNVTVTVTSADTAQVRTATTGADGTYKVPLLNPGEYRVKFDAAGFQSVEIPSVTVTVTEIGTLNRQLSVGAQTQQVTVEANVETVQTASSTVGTVVNSKVMTDIPLSTRNYTNLIGLTAGANASVQNATAIGKGAQAVYVNGSSNQQNTWQMDGAFITNFDGRNDLSESGTFGSIAVPNPDALQEFKIQTSNFDASYGRNPGASVNVVTRSGSNAYHGAAFEFFRNTVLNANDFFLNRAGVERGVLNQNQFGGVFGGPIKKDKFFFFASVQETQQKNGFATIGLQQGIVLPPIPLGDRGSCPLGAATVAACDGPSQTFAAALGANICPTNNLNSQSIANSQSGASRSNFTLPAAGTQVACSGSNINPVALRILQLKTGVISAANPNGYYVPSSLSLAACATCIGNYRTTSYSVPAIYHEHQGLGNLDYVLNSKNTLALRFFYSIDPESASFPAGIGGGVGNTLLPGDPANLQYENMNNVLKLTTIVTNNLVNEARFSYQRNATTIVPGPNNFTASQVGMTPAQAGSNYLPFLNITGLLQLGTPSSALVYTRVNQYQVADTISWTHGKHSVRGGVEVDHEFYYYNLKGFPIGQDSASTFADVLLGLPGGVGAGTTGVPTGFLSAIATTGRTPAEGNVHHIIGNSTSAFIQDDFKLSQRLTINAGLRWEFDKLPSDNAGRFSSVWPSLISLQPFPGSGCVYNGVTYGLGAGGTGCSFVGYEAPANYSVAANGPLAPGVYVNNLNSAARNATPWNNFAPRVGFAWQPLSTNKFVVRGGVGYFYDRVTAGEIGTQFAQSAPTLNPFTCNGATCAASSLGTPYPSAANAPLGWAPRWVNFANGTSSNLTVGGGVPIAQNFLTPLVYEYNLNIQYEFLPTWVAEIGYVGSHGIHQLGGFPFNPSLLANIANPASCGYDGVATDCIRTSTLTGGTAATGGSGCTAIPCGGTALRAPYLGFQPTEGATGTTNSFKYNSFQATVRKQFSRGMSFQAAYTWSRAFNLSYVGNPNTSFANNVPVITEYGLNAGASGLSGGYRPHRLTVNYSWLLPFGHHEGLMDKLVGGWTFSGVTTIQGGAPLTVTDSNGGGVFGKPLTSNAQYAAGMGPDNVGMPGSTDSKAQLGHTYLNPAAFVSANTLLAANIPGCSGAAVTSPCTGTYFGNSGLGVVLGPGQNNWDMSFAKLTRVGGLREDATLQFRAEFFNTFNHPQFNNPILTFNTASTFGQLQSSSVNQRLIQFALKYSF